MKSYSFCLMPTDERSSFMFTLTQSKHTFELHNCIDCFVLHVMFGVSFLEWTWATNKTKNETFYPPRKKSSRNAQGTHLSTCFFRTRVTRTRFNNSFSRSIFWRKFRFPNQIMALLKTFLYAGAVFVSIREWGTRNLRIYQPKSWIIGHFIEFWAQIRTKNFSIFIIDVVIIRIYGTCRVLGCDKNALKQLHRYESTFRIWKKMCLLPKRDNGKKKRKSTIKQTRNLDQI